MRLVLRKIMFGVEFGCCREMKFLVDIVFLKLKCVMVKVVDVWMLGMLREMVVWVMFMVFCFLIMYNV